MKLTQIATEKILRRLFAGKDYRSEVLTLIDSMFLQHVIDFFRQIVEVKLSGAALTGEWYKEHFLHPDFDKHEVGVNAGLNMKTISNTYGTTRKEVVLEVSLEHYDELKEVIQELVEAGEDLNIQLTIKFRSVSVELDLSETLIVINSLAVKRAQIRGGAFSTTGKQVELPFMIALAKLYGLSREFYGLKALTEDNREIDFHFRHPDGTIYNCEFKLMGRGNPESADAAIARDTDIFVADTLSQTNKAQFDNLGIHWVELRSENGFRRLYTVLRDLGFPVTPIVEDDLEMMLSEVIAQAFAEISAASD